MTKTGKTIIYSVLGTIVLILGLLLVIVWKAGVFAGVEIAMAEKGPYHYVYIEKTGPFSEVPKAHKQVTKLLEDQNIKGDILCGVYLDNPAEVEQSKMRWRAGYMVGDSVAVEEPLIYEFVGTQNFVVGSIKAHPMVAPFKTYPALEKWIEANNYQVAGYAFELYNENGVIDVMFPIVKKE